MIKKAKAQPNRKPLLMMRTRGLSGPRATKHVSSTKASKSVGNAVTVGIIP